MTMKLAIPVRNARLQAIADALDAGAGVATLTLYAGTMPAQLGGPLQQEHTELVALELPRPVASEIINGVLTLAPIPDQMAVNEGLATWGRFRDGDGTLVADGDVGQEASGALIELPTALIYAGALVGISSASLAEG